MKHPGLAALLVIALCAVPVRGAEAQVSAAAVKAFPDFLSMRAEFLSSVITATPARALAFQPAFRDTAAGRVRVSVERAGESFYVLFQREREGSFPVASRGNVIIKREAATGYVTRVVWYLSDDGRSFISLAPRNERTLVDLVIAGGVHRSGYSVSRLIYNFFTNSFSYLYEATKAGLDWAAILGVPGPDNAAGLGAELRAGAGGAASELVRAAADFSTMGIYLNTAGYPDAVPVEVSEVRAARVATFADPRDPQLAVPAAWSEARGLPVEVALSVVVEGIGAGSAFVAMFDAAPGLPPLKLAVVPYRGTSGVYEISAVNADARAPIDFQSVLASRPGSFIRLFRVPVGGS